MTYFVLLFAKKYEDILKQCIESLRQVKRKTRFTQLFKTFLSVFAQTFHSVTAPDAIL